MPEHSQICPVPVFAPKRIATSRGRNLMRGSAPASYWCLLIFVFLLYVNVPLLFPAIEVIRPAKLAAGGAALLLVFETTFGRRKFALGLPEGGLLLSFLVAAGLSCITALWPGYAVAGVIDLVKMSIIFFFLVNCVTSLRLLRGIMWAMVLGGLFPALGAIRNYLQGNLVEGRASWIGVFANPNDLAYTLVVLVPLAGFLAARRGLLTRAFLYTLTAVFCGGIFVTFSRGGALGLIAVLGLYSWRLKGAFVKIVLIVAILGGAIFATQHWTRGEDFEGLGRDNTVQSRMATSVAGLQMFLDSPITGVGFACSVVAWPLYAPDNLYTRGALVTHNTFIQALSETGLLGFTTFMLFLGLGVYRARRLAFRSAEPEVANLAAGIEIALCGFAVCGLANGYVLTWYPYILVGMAVSLGRIAESK
jgi:putative inorganic carbon (HCO3(-)) transporter